MPWVKRRRPVPSGLMAMISPPLEVWKTTLPGSVAPAGGGADIPWLEEASACATGGAGARGTSAQEPAREEPWRLEPTRYLGSTIAPDLPTDEQPTEEIGHSALAPEATAPVRVVEEETSTPMPSLKRKRRRSLVNPDGRPRRRRDSPDEEEGDE